MNEWAIVCIHPKLHIYIKDTRNILLLFAADFKIQRYAQSVLVMTNCLPTLKDFTNRTCGIPSLNN